MTDTTNITQILVDEVLAERVRQDNKYGKDKDDKNTTTDWIVHICSHATKSYMYHRSFRDQMIRVAALAIAAIESHDRQQVVKMDAIKKEWQSFFDLISKDCSMACINMGTATLIWTAGFLEHYKGEVTLEQLRERYSKLYFKKS